MLFEESDTSTDKSDGKIFNKHTELKIAIDKACEYSQFLEQRIKKSANSADEIELSSSVRVQKIDDPNYIYVCYDNRSNEAIPGCKRLPSDQSQAKQEQYLINLIGLLKTRFGMNQSALFVEKSAVKNDGSSFSSEKEVAMSPELLRCQTKSKLPQNE